MSSCARRFRFELFVLGGLLNSFLIFPRPASGSQDVALTVEAHNARVNAIRKDLDKRGINVEAKYGCDGGPNPYRDNDLFLLVLELIDHYKQLNDQRQANLWNRHMGWFYELGLRDCGVLNPEEAGAGGRSLLLAHKLYRDSGATEDAARVLAQIRGSAVANGTAPPTTYRGMGEE